jgi:hypothetical protein
MNSLGLVFRTVRVVAAFSLVILTGAIKAAMLLLVFIGEGARTADARRSRPSAYRGSHPFDDKSYWSRRFWSK